MERGEEGGKEGGRKEEGRKRLEGRKERWREGCLDRYMMEGWKKQGMDESVVGWMGRFMDG